MGDYVSIIQETFKPGREIGPSDWHLVTQEQINDFAKASFDFDPMHVDPEWCKDNSPFGVPVAFGFMTMSMLTHFINTSVEKMIASSSDLKMPAYGLNYGFDRMRLVSHVPVNSRIRARFTVLNTEPKGHGVLLRFKVVVEIEDSDQPALVGEWLSIGYDT